MKKAQPKTRSRQARTAPQPAEPVISREAIRRHGFWIAALWMLALAAYSNSFRTGFPFDNTTVILLNSRVHAVTAQNIHLILNEDYWYGSSTTGLYRPVTTLTYLLNYAVLGNGPHPAGYHWLNFGLHAVNIALVYLLAMLIFEEAAPAFAVAAIWGVHPVLTESVTNIVGRADLLAAFGVLAGLVCHARGAIASGRQKLAWLTVLFCVTLIGLFSKESAIVVLAAIAIYDLAFASRAPWRARIPGYFALATASVVYFSVRADVLARLPLGVVPFGDNPLVGADFWTARLTAFKAIAKAFGLLVWPLHLAADYSYNAIPLFSWNVSEDWKSVAGLSACLVAAAIAAWCYRHNKRGFFFLALLLASLAPTSNIFLTIGTILAERFLYLPAVAFAGCLVLVLGRQAGGLPHSLHRARPAMLALIVVAFAARTWLRNLDWADDQTLWARTVQTSPASYKAHSLLAASLMNARPPQLDRASAAAGRSLEILDPLPDELRVARAYAIAGECYRNKGDSPSGFERSTWYRRSLDALLRGQRIDLIEREQVRRRNMARGKRAIATGWLPLYEELGRTYLAMGDARQAAIKLMEGLVINPGATQLAAELAALYRQAEPASCALQGTGLDLNCPLVHEQLCVASRNVAALYQQIQEPDSAAAVLHSAASNLGCR